MSIKLWIILFALRELVKFVQQKLKQQKEQQQKTKKQQDIELEQTILDSLNDAKIAMKLFAKKFLNVNPNDTLRSFEETFFRQAILAFPYKQSILYQSLIKLINSVEFGKPPSAYYILIQSLFGHRFVETANFCQTCWISCSNKQCKNCKVRFGFCNQFFECVF